MAEPKPESELTGRQAAFVREYLVDRNGTQAAIRAGYSAKSATEQASTLLTYPKVCDAIEREASALAAATQINREKLLREWLASYNVDTRNIAKIKIICCEKCWEGLEPALHPDAECKVCNGMGVPVLKVEDADKLTIAEARMIKSVKMGKYGPEVTFHDNHAMLDRIGKALAPVAPGGDAANPLHVLIQQIQGNAIKTVEGTTK